MVRSVPWLLVGALGVVVGASLGPFVLPALSEEPLEKRPAAAGKEPAGGVADSVAHLKQYASIVEQCPSQIRSYYGESGYFSAAGATSARRPAPRQEVALAAKAAGVRIDESRLDDAMPELLEVQAQHYAVLNRMAARENELIRRADAARGRDEPRVVFVCATRNGVCTVRTGDDAVYDALRADLDRVVASRKSAVSRIVAELGEPVRDK